MTAFPAGIIFVNQEVSDSVKSTLSRQLFIDEILDGYVFIDRVTADPNYHKTVQIQNKRIMVFFDFMTRADIDPDIWQSCDLALFVKYGLGSVEANRWGPHGLTLPVSHITWIALGFH